MLVIQNLKKHNLDKKAIKKYPTEYSLFMSRCSGSVSSWPISLKSLVALPVPTARRDFLICMHNILENMLTSSCSLLQILECEFYIGSIKHGNKHSWEWGCMYEVLWVLRQSRKALYKHRSIRCVWLIRSRRIIKWPSMASVWSFMPDLGWRNDSDYRRSLLMIWSQLGLQSWTPLLTHYAYWTQSCSVCPASHNFELLF